jgi:hypothetical protein
VTLTNAYRATGQQAAAVMARARVPSGALRVEVRRQTSVCDVFVGAVVTKRVLITLAWVIFGHGVW